jgi:hypothetical protein
MASWAAGFSVATEILEEVLNLVLDRFLALLRARNQNVFTTALGTAGSLTAELQLLRIRDLRDPAPVGGGVLADLATETQLQLTVFGTTTTTTMDLALDDVDVDLSTTAAKLPRGVILRVSPTFNVTLSFQGAGLLTAFLNLVAPFIRLGLWLAFRLVQRVEVPLWELVDVFSALGLRFAPGSPLLTAAGATPTSSLLLASDFNLTAPTTGVPAQLQRFVPAGTNIAAVVNERMVAAAVDVAFAKGWIPTTFRVQGFKISINNFEVAFEQDTIVARGQIRGKRGGCWTRVKFVIRFRAAVRPRVVDTPTATSLVFQYDADVNVHVSTSGMLVVLGVILFAPVFLSLTILLSFLVNIVLDQFLPFTTSFSVSGLSLTVQATSVHFSGFVPLSMTFPLQLTGSGSYDLTRFRQFQLPNGAGTVSVGYTNDSLSVQPHEMRAAVRLS